MMGLNAETLNSAYGPHRNESYAHVAQRLKNKLRQYNLLSIIKLTLNHLHRQHPDRVKELRDFPWLAALVAKLALEDQMVAVSSGPDCPQNVFEDCCNELWAVHDHSTEGSQYHLLLTLRGMMHAQFLFQKNPSAAYLRWPALIARLPKDHPSAQLFHTSFNMSALDFMLTTTAVMSSLLKNGYDKPLLLSVFSVFPTALKANLNQFLLMFCKDALSLRKVLREELSKRIQSKTPPRPPYERLEFPWLSNYPLFSLRDNQVITWHPLIFYQGIENAVHNRLSLYGQQYSDDFSKLFEQYVIELIETTGIKPITDKMFKELGNASMSAVDALIPSKQGNVLIEAKMSLFTDELLISERPDVVYKKLKRIRKAISQAWKVGDLLRDGSVHIDEADHAKQDYLLIVTSRQIMLGNGKHLTNMVKEDFFEHAYPKDGILKPTETQLERLPPENITILSIEEFEHLVGAVIEGKLTFLHFAADAAERALNPNDTVMIADQITKDYVKKWHIPAMIEKARDDMTDQLRRHLNAN